MNYQFLGYSLQEYHNSSTGILLKSNDIFISIYYDYGTLKTDQIIIETLGATSKFVFNIEDFSEADLPTDVQDFLNKVEEHYLLFLLEHKAKLQFELYEISKITGKYEYLI